MKKFLVFVLFLFAFVAFNLVAEETGTEGTNYDPLVVKENDSLIPDYFEKMLFVKTGTRTTISVGAYGYTASGRSEEVWYPMRGSKEISKIEFFKILNNQQYIDEFVNYEKKKNAHNIGRYVSYGIMGAGAIFSLVSFLMYMKTFKDNTSVANTWKICTFVGLGVTFASVIPITVLYLTSPKEPNVSVSFVVALANKYNQTNGYVL